MKVDISTAARLTLTGDEIHLWLASYDVIIDESLRQAYWDLLDPAERARQRFHFARDRQRYLVTRALVRTVLSRYVPLHPKEWRFEPSAYGRPQIANAWGKIAGLSFNISHTHSLIVLGVTGGRALGVDVENIMEREVSLDIAHHHFSPLEVEALSAVLPCGQQYRFFEYWTFKESYIKARGMGLSLPLDKFSFHYAHDRAIGLTIDPDLADDAARWQFWQFRPAPEYLLAVCAERLGSSSPALIVRQAMPLQSERLVTPQLLRASH